MRMFGKMTRYMIIVHGEDVDGTLFDKIFFKSKYEDAMEICDLADRCAFSYDLYKYISRTRMYKSILKG